MNKKFQITISNGLVIFFTYMNVFCYFQVQTGKEY